MSEVEEKVVFWTCNEDAEYLTRESADEAYEEYLDDMGLNDWPETLKAFGYSRKKVNKERLKRVILEAAEEHLDEEYGGEDGHDINDEIEKACDSFVNTYIDNYTPWQCEQVTSEEINVKEWVKENNPEWLEDGPF